MTKKPRPGFEPGFLLFEAQRLEDLSETLLLWLARHPAQPLEEDLILVPSNAMGEWLKGQVAMRQGIFAGTRVELPARFAWRIYRQFAAPGTALQAVLDKASLAWILAGHWQEWSRNPRIQEALAIAEVPLPAAQRLPPQAVELEIGLWNWCARVADLFDQYQIYRADWLADWAQGRRQLRTTPELPDGRPLPVEQEWQGELWRWVAQHLGQASQMDSRNGLHQSCIEALEGLAAGQAGNLPSRIILFGANALAPQMVELLHALSRHCSVIFAVPNPCQVPWADPDDAAVEGHPLLAAWGRQTRDFIAQLSRFEDRLAARGHELPRAEFDIQRSPATALEELQAAIHANEPSQEAPAERPLGASAPSWDDGSIRFVTAYTPLREVEILHDHLLTMLGGEGAEPRIQARDVVVMVPDLDPYVPAIRAVFGGYPTQDPRFIPWGLTDRHVRPDDGLIELARWLLSLPQQRCTLPDLLRLLQTPALQRRWGLAEDDVEHLIEWAQASGIRWGLSAAHRAGLGMPGAGETMTWRFGVDRMLAGYASGATAAGAQAGVDLPYPLAQVSGLAAKAAGRLSALLERLDEWREQCLRPQTPMVWAQALRGLMSDLFEAEDPADLRQMQALESALAGWVTATREAGFEGLVHFEVVCQVVIDQASQPSTTARFRAGGVTFCTLMPLRALPFQAVCLLGMNDGAYPRPSIPRPGDLMADPALARPGDRSRRVDDRQLMLDAVLSARRQLYVSWVGRRANDNQPQHPSVLVGQLRDTLEARWGRSALDAITQEHPLHPFSALYFRQGNLPPTYSHEWQAVAVGEPSAAPVPQQDGSAEASGSLHEPTVGTDPASDARVLRWLDCPVAAFWADRLRVRWDDADVQQCPEDEVFALDGLQAWNAWDAVKRSLRPSGRESPMTVPEAVARWSPDLDRQGLLPLGAPGRFVRQLMESSVQELYQRHEQARAQPGSHRVIVLASNLRVGRESERSPVWRMNLLLAAWWEQACQAARGQPHQIMLLCPDATANAQAPEPADAERAIHSVRTCLARWWELEHPMPATSALLPAFSSPPHSLPRTFDTLAKRNAAWRRSFGDAGQWAWQDHESGRPWSQWHEATHELYGPFFDWWNRHVRVVSVLKDDSGGGA